jgi:methanol metabolism-related c-type cytochrome
MTYRLIAFASAVFLSTTSLVGAQGTGTTVVPAGQEAPAANTAAPAGGADAATSTAPQAAQAPAEGAAATAEPAAAEAATEEEAPAAAEAPAEAPAADGGASMASAEAMQPDAHPSMDTETAGNQATEGDQGKFADSAGNPTYNIDDEGKVDWYAWRGSKKYGANCLQCHGPDGLGSSFAPDLTESLTHLSYFDFVGIVVSGQQNKWHPQNSVMPAWGEDPNVMCSLDAIYIYLRGRADGVIGRGEPPRPEKNEEAQAAEYECLGF